jgi:NAD(P)-dependent dehydrogenase (short-subunit alcohol dehydrogenase family)
MEKQSPLETLFSLRGHVALVTGASVGLGAECAHALALAGADVALVARREGLLRTLASKLTETYGVKALPIAADITIDADLDRVVSRTVAELGEVDILVNNAGIAPGGRAEKYSRELWDAAFALNVTAPMMLSQKIARRLIERKKPGRIINMTSVAGYQASPVFRYIGYASSKAALANLTRQLAIEWADYGILVNAVAPGLIPTEMNAETLARPAIQERNEAFTPFKRLGKPEEVRGAVILLASAASSYMTGATIVIDGGREAW